MASFRNERYFLSNMYPCKVVINLNNRLYEFTCSESVFQALKCPERIDEFLSIDGYAAKRLGKQVKASARWHDPEYRINIMRYALDCKFRQNPQLAEKLMQEKGEIVEINEWYDTFWGVCNNIGENHLGKLLMEIRDKLIRERT